MYKIILNIHILSAYLFIAIIFFITYKWQKLSLNKRGVKTLKKAHQFTGILGWMLLISGASLLYIINGQFLLFSWMKFSIGLFIFIQVFDHFWADKQEKRNENWSIKYSYLNIWLIVKVFLYLLIMFLMYLKPI